MRLMVYGTLKRDGANNGLLRGLAPVEEKFYAIDGHSLRANPESMFPFLTSCGETNPFWGEVYEIDEQILKDTDNLEGHPTFYTRKFFQEWNFWTYVFEHDDAFELDIIEDFKNE